MHPQEVDIGTSKFDLKFSIWENATGFQGSLEYKTDLFNATTITSINKFFEMLLHAVVQQPSIKVDELVELLALNNQQQQLIQAKELESTSLQKLKQSKRKAICSN